MLVVIIIIIIIMLFVLHFLRIAVQPLDEVEFVCVVLLLNAHLLHAVRLGSEEGVLHHHQQDVEHHADQQNHKRKHVNACQKPERGAARASLREHVVDAVSVSDGEESDGCLVQVAEVVRAAAENGHSEQRVADKQRQKPQQSPQHSREARLQRRKQHVVRRVLVEKLDYLHPSQETAHSAYQRPAMHRKPRTEAVVLVVVVVVLDVVARRLRQLRERHKQVAGIARQLDENPLVCEAQHLRQLELLQETGFVVAVVLAGSVERESEG